ncbi:MAG: hypothetical protein JNL08_04735 [Planctomycetes bacterium]|nr:hypothetical protein [Planctomycetota bacterium]
MRTLLGGAALLLAACSNGGGGPAGGAGGSLQPFAIDAAASPAVAASVADLLEVGDHFAYEPDVAAANAIYDQIWQRLVAAPQWLEPGDTTAYEFFDDSDPVTNWGRAYRYFGNGTFAGPMQPFTAGTYTRPNGVDLPALTLTTWDSRAELIVLLDDDTFVHAIQNTNGLPIVEVFARQ